MSLQIEYHLYNKKLLYEEQEDEKNKNAYDIILHINWTDKKLVYLHNSSIPKEQL